MIPKKYRFKRNHFSRKSDKFLEETKKLLEKEGDIHTLYYYQLRLEMEERGLAEPYHLNRR